jgi:hypothetical protein
METYIQRLEARVEHIERGITDIKTDIRITWAATIASNLGLAGLMAKGFGWL